MITKPGWYVFNTIGTYTVFQTFKFSNEHKYWTYNTLFSHVTNEKSLDDEDSVIFLGSTMESEAKPLIYARYEIMRTIFEKDISRLVIGSDYT